MAERGADGPVSSEMLIGEVLLRFPSTLPVFKRHGLPCPICLANSYENVAQVAVMLGVDLLTLLVDLNTAAAVQSGVATRWPFGREPERN